MEILKKIQRKLFFHLQFAKPEASDVFYTLDFFKEKKYCIGEFTYGKPKILFENEESNLILGKYCSIAEDVTVFLGGNHRVDWVTTYPFNILNKDFANIEKHSATKGNVEIGNDVWIGFKSTILSGVKIADGAVIAACSVVTKDIGPYEIWGGNPARFIKNRFTDNQIQKLLEIQWWNWDDNKVRNNMTGLCSENIEEFLLKHNINKVM